MRKVVYFVIPILTLAAFVLLMNSAQNAKKPLGDEDNFPGYMQLLKEDINQEDWESANSHLTKLETAWEEVIPRIQYTVERDEFSAVDRSVSRVRGTIAAKDKTGALVEINELENNWGELGR